jgi:hypothetical protein
MAYVTHMMKERSKGVETAKCGAAIKMTKSTAPMSIWYRNVDCPECLTAMGMYRTKEGTVLTEADIDKLAAEAERGYDVSTITPRKRVIPRQP